MRKLTKRFRRRKIPPTLKKRLLVTVNTTLALLFGTFLVLDYQREYRVRLDNMRTALEQEANTLLPAVLQMRGRVEIQRYLNRVCHQMDEPNECRHRIGVQIDEEFIQSSTTSNSLTNLSEVLDREVSTGSLAPEFLIIGRAQSGSVTALVAQPSDSIHQEVITGSFWRVGCLLLLWGIAAGIASKVLITSISRPVRALLETIAQVSHGNFEDHPTEKSTRELAMLSMALRNMSQSLRKAESQRHRQLEMAREIQQHLLPDTSQIPGLRVATLYQPASEVAGDYYDVIRLEDGSWLIGVADVCGHGIPAAMTAAMLKTLLQHASEYHVHPNAILGFVNHQLVEISPPGMFATMMVLRWSPDTRQIEFASAGHVPAYSLVENSPPSQLSSTGIPLGIDKDSTWKNCTIDSAIGQKLFIPTDGVMETMNPAGDIFGKARLLSLLHNCHHLSVEQIVHRMDDNLARYRETANSNDDMTVMALEVRPEMSAKMSYAA